MKVLVTGGAGFIGSHLVEGALAAGHEVRVLDNLSTGRLGNLASVRDRVEFLKGDLRSLEDCDKAVHGAEVVFHLAALPSVQRSMEDPSGSHAVNGTGTVNVLEAARSRGVRRVVYASSSSIYGNAPALPKREDQAPEPLSPYAASKLSGELYGRVFAASMGLEVVSLRFFNVFGPRQDPDSPYSAVVPIFLRLLKEGKPPVIYGDGEQVRDFTYVSNVVEALLAAAAAPGPKASGRVFNVACGQGTSVNRMLASLQSILGTRVAAVHAPPRAGEVTASVADVSAAKAALGWTPAVGLEEGLRRTVGACARIA